MNILLIGNGFDLAHGLHTKYTDFLVFCKMVLKFIENNKIIIPSNNENKNAEKWINDSSNLVCFISLEKLEKIFIDEFFFELSERDREVYTNMFNNYLIPMFYGKNRDYRLIKELLYSINRNFWVIYFLDNPLYQKENWIDFEGEISQVIQSFSKDIQDLDKGIDQYINGEMISNRSLQDIYSKYNAVQKYSQVRDELLCDLNKLIRVFEIYLSEYIEKINIDTISPDIKGLDIDYVLSFNYTHTFSRRYQVSDKGSQTQERSFNYIHGEANIDNTIDSNNMVLGIDEYLPEDRKNRDVEFIRFKKYFQRIHKETGSKYKEWLDEINEDFNSVIRTDKQYLKLVLVQQHYHLYIFGHSLDVTDKDILRELILTQGMFTTIFYRDLDQKGQQIANLVKVIGQDELIKRTGRGSARTIEFVKQRDMEKIK